MIPNGRTIIAEICIEQLSGTYEVLLQKYPGLVKQKRFLLEHDNTKPHTAKVNLDKDKEFGSIHHLPYLAFSPDLAPSDYYLTMAKYFLGKKLNRRETLKIQ
ncbi:Mariner Mos1 transposase [Eumeta japonica]|uniref:Mariner Mos1 transposase n=1 Tax=Eumeta variegata TaxID=151549 RepID=A0A4C1ZVU0_EUMVA|nr:Mariner Mos1 transposase [Eumeta japonica]